MFSHYIKSLLAVLLATGFMSNSYAEWNYNKNKTKCKGTHCVHTTVHKHCQGGKCWDTKHKSVYNR